MSGRRALLTAAFRHSRSFHQAACVENGAVAFAGGRAYRWPACSIALICRMCVRRGEQFVGPIGLYDTLPDRTKAAEGHEGAAACFGSARGGPGSQANLPDAHTDFIFSVSGRGMRRSWRRLCCWRFTLMVFAGFRCGRPSWIDGIARAAGKPRLFSLFGRSGRHQLRSFNVSPESHRKRMTLPFCSYGVSSLIAQDCDTWLALALCAAEQGTRNKRQAMR